MAYCGDLDIIGNRRPISYYREIVWGLRKVPYIAVQLPQHYDDIPFCTPWSNVDSLSSWTWPGYEGKKVRVEVYAESDETELFLNKKSLGKMPTGEANRFKAIFEITYEPGILEAVSYSNNQETGRFALNTADDAKEISVNCDKTSLCLGKEDLSYLMISIRDESGNLNTAADTILTVDVEGAGILQGFGSADPISTENFFDKSRTTFNGKVLAVVKAGNERGVIKVTVSSKEFNSKIVEIKVI
jgi:beta-galactosidase